MVAAGFALHSLAVLAAIGFAPVSAEGRLARFRQRLADRDETDTLYETLVPTTESSTSIPVLTSTPKPPTRPSKAASEAGNAAVTTLDLGQPAASEDGESGSPSSDSSLSSSSESSPPAVSDTSYITLRTESGSVTSTVVAASTVKPPSRPGKATSVVYVASVSTSLDLGNPAATSDVASSSAVSDTSYITLRTESGSVTVTVVAASTVKPPNRPGKLTSTVDTTTVSLTLDLGHQGASSDAANPDDSTVSSTVGLKATYSLAYSDSSSTSSSTEYIYPGEYGAGGTLTTDSNAPTRTVAPSKSSVIPGSSSGIGPPPADTSVFTSSTKPPALPSLIESTPDVVVDSTSTSTSTSNDDFSYLPGGPIVGSTSLSSSPTKATAPPKVPPVRPTSSTSTRRSSITLDLGQTDTAVDDVTPTEVTTPPAVTSTTTPPTWPFSNSSLWGNSTAPTFTTYSLPTSSTSSTASMCAATDLFRPSTTYSIVHTATITWFGNPTDYTPPYEPISTPQGCNKTPYSPIRLTPSFCSPTGTGKDSTPNSACLTSTASLIYTTAAPTSHSQITITFVTTDKNPAVVYSSIETPNYGLSQPGSTLGQVDHSSTSPTPSPKVTTPEYQSQTTGVFGGASVPNQVPASNNAGAGANNPGHAAPSPQPITVGVQPTGVVINGQTVVDNSQTPTQTVTIAGQTFTINPTQVVGAGQTIDRPSATGGVFVATPTSTQIQGVSVTVSSSVAIIGGTTFTLGPTPTTAVVSGQAVTVGPGGVVVASTTIPVLSVPSPTQVVVEGGELITAIGASVVVIRGTTITYGPGTAARTTVVDDDTITIGPSGVVVHGTLTLGGAGAGPSETRYEIVGGATVTQIGPSVVVVDNTTYTVGPGAGTTTTVVGGETVTIGPAGVAVSTYTIAYPFGPTTTITPKATAVVGTASPTASKDAATALRRPAWAWLTSCIAIGVWGFAF